MGIGPSSAYWMRTLQERNVFDGGKSVIELGPSLFRWPEKPLLRFLDKYYPDKDQQARFLGKLTLADGTYKEPVARGFYELLGFEHYDAIDYGDGDATIKHDLNQELPITRQYDLVADFGTIEHVFNIGEAFRTVHNLTRPGGVNLHVLATFGGYYHGFYNTHSVTWKSLAQANNYEVLDLLYLHDMQVEHRRVEKHLYAKFEDIKDREVRLQHIRFFVDYFSSLITGKERTHSHILAAFRKTSDKPFVYPHQINKYSIDTDTQLWEEELRPQVKI